MLEPAWVTPDDACRDKTTQDMNAFLLDRLTFQNRWRLKVIRTKANLRTHPFFEVFHSTNES